MKKILFLLAAVGAVAIGAMLSTVDVKAQCNGVFPNNTMCGNVSGVPSVPQAVPVAAIPVSGNTSWINVKQAPCSAVGNGIADDTAAINTCIATFNNTSNGVLYFPAGIYLTTTTLTTITGSGIVRGDGATNLAGNPVTPPSPKATLIETSSLTVNGLTFNTAGANSVRDLSLYNISGTTPIAGAGITQISPVSFGKLNVNQVHVRGYNVGIDLQEAASGVTIENTIVWDPVLYGIRVRNLVNADDGGWVIRGSGIYPITRTATSGIRWDGSGGGGSINDTHIVGASATISFTNGIDLQGTGATVDMGIVNDSIENIASNFININGSIPNVWIQGVEFGGFVACNSCIGINVNSTSLLIASGLIFGTNNFAPPIKLVSCTQCYVRGVTLASGQVGGVYGNWPSADHDGTGGIGGSAYFASTTSVNSQNLTWTGPASVGSNLRVAEDPGTSNQSANFVAINDTGIQAQFGVTGSTNGTLANQGGMFANRGLFILSDSTVVSGGSDPVTIAAGGFNQEALLVQSNGHIRASGLGQSAPTIAGGCGGTSSIVAGTDTAAFVTGQNTAVTSCILQFGAAFTTAPICTATGGSSPLTGTVTASTTSLTVHFTSTTSYTWSYQCLGK